jgi:hypothetical protein
MTYLLEPCICIVWILFFCMNEVYIKKRIFCSVTCAAIDISYQYNSIQLLDNATVVTTVSLCHRGGRMENINAWYLNTHMVYL